MRQGVRRKVQVDYFRDKIPIKPAQKEVPEEDESESDAEKQCFMDHTKCEITGELIRVTDERKKERRWDRSD